MDVTNDQPPVVQPPAVSLPGATELVFRKRKLNAKQLRNPHVADVRVLCATGKLSKKQYLRDRHACIGSLQQCGKNVLGAVVPCDDHGNSRPYNVSDLCHDRNCGFLAPIDPLDDSALPPEPAVAYSAALSASPLVLVDTIHPGTCTCPFLTQEQRFLANSLRDVDKDARILFQFIDESNGTAAATVTEHLFVRPTELPEHTGAGMSYASFDLSSDPKHYRDAMSRPDKQNGSRRFPMKCAS